MTYPSFLHERELWNDGFSVAGIDEAGRGAFAGPLAVGGVVLPPTSEDALVRLGINDSKLVRPHKREMLYDEIINHSLSWHVELVPVDVINAIGIGKATFAGMKKVSDAIGQKINNTYLLIDAFTIPDVINQKGVIHGDRVSISVAAASILAKVTRDRYMIELADKFPQYGFEKHKGYGTKFHRDALAVNGLTHHHRTQFCKTENL